MYLPDRFNMYLPDIFEKQTKPNVIYKTNSCVDIFSNKPPVDKQKLFLTGSGLLFFKYRTSVPL